MRNWYIFAVGAFLLFVSLVYFYNNDFTAEEQLLSWRFYIPSTSTVAALAMLGLYWFWQGRKTS